MEKQRLILPKRISRLKTSTNNQDQFNNEKCFNNQKPIKLSSKMLNQSPHSLIGAITFQNERGIVGMGTGILISPNLVLTAAHNYYSHHPSEYYQHFRFYIGQHGHLENYIQGEEWYIPKEFKEKNTSTTDYALMKLASSIPVKNFLPLESVEYLQKSDKIGIFGYLGRQLESSDPYNRYDIYLYQWGLTGNQKMIECFRQEERDVLYRLSTFPGQSGAPLLLIGDDRSCKIIGIHKGGVKLKQGEDKFFNVSRHITVALIQELKEGAKQLGAIPFWKEEDGDKQKNINIKNESIIMNSKGQFDGNKCPGCSKTFPQELIFNHIETCQHYKPTIYRQISRIGSNISPNVLKFLKKQLELSLQKITQIENNLISKKQKQIKDNQTFANVFEHSIQMEYGGYTTNIVQCQNCDKNFYENFDRDILFYVYDCWHVFCKPCINKYVTSEFVNQGGKLKCLKANCNKIMLEDQIRDLLRTQKFQTLQNKAIRNICNLIECTKCKIELEFQEGNPREAPKKDIYGKDITPELAKDYAANRFICPSSACKTEQCRSCHATPYHLGMTCKQFKRRALIKKCRYCDESIFQKNVNLDSPKALLDICNKKECQEIARGACVKIHDCGHPCFGFRGENECLPCLNKKCAEGNSKLNGVYGDQYCAVCYVEALSASPCIRSTCGHIFHVKCLKKRFEIKWSTPYIFFNFCLCPLCKRWITVSKESELFKYSEENRLLSEKIQKMAENRIKFQELEKSDPKLQEKASPYYGKTNEYAMIIYAYFMCFKCKNPYFGGRKDCVTSTNEDQGAVESFKPEELICPGCYDVPIENCPKHRKDFMEFKCKFCCNIANWFCWGNTHFCIPCYKRQCNGDYVSKYAKDKLPKCGGPGVCPIGGNHNGNGDQRSLGCAMCLNYKENKKNF